MANPVSASTPATAFYIDFTPTRGIPPAAKPNLDRRAGAAPTVEIICVDYTQPQAA